MHDLSKFSPIEFFESVKYYDGKRSPIEASKEINGYSLAWLHHKGRNDHHYEYWQDNFDSGTSHIKIPYDAFCEMICDWFGAGLTYNGKDFKPINEYNWWYYKIRPKALAINQETIRMIDYVMDDLRKSDSFDIICENLKNKKYE